MCFLKHIREWVVYLRLEAKIQQGKCSRKAA